MPCRLMKSRNSLVGVAVTELVYSQRVLLIGLTLSSHSACTLVRPFGVKASESETMRQRCGSVISPI